jgi:hypothetical protein
MAWNKAQGKGETERFNIRLDRDTGAFYRRKANQAGVSISEFLRKTLYEGVIAENIQDAEERMQALIATIPANFNANGTGFSDDLALSILTCEAMLSAIVKAQSIQAFYDAQNAAKEKLAKLKEKQT